MKIAELNPSKPSSAFVLTALAVFLLLTQFSHAAGLNNMILTPTEDAFVRSSYASQKKNYGKEAYLELLDGRATSQAYIKFDLSSVEMFLKQAKLRFYAEMEKPTLATIVVRSVGTNEWSENTLNWKEKADYEGEIGKLDLVGSGGAWYELDITRFLKSELALGNKMLSIVLLPTDSGGNRITINSREAGAERPELVLTRSQVKAQIVFRPREAGGPSGYLVDTGEVYGFHSNGFTYGWNQDVTTFVRDHSASDRTSGKSSRPPDVRYACSAQMDDPKMEKPAFWGISVPNGKYRVHIVAGDASSYDSVYAIQANGVMVLDGIPEASKRWVENSATVPVTNQKIIVTNSPKSINNKICFIEITETQDAADNSSALEK